MLLYSRSTKHMKQNESQLIIGRNDRATFPEFDLDLINVKVDTGAYTTAIHCCRISLTEDNRLRVVFLDENDPSYTGKTFEFTEFKTKDVRSSNGAVEERFIISTQIEFGDILFDIDLSLTSRGDMRSPVLLGRKFLSANHFIINPRLNNSLYRKWEKRQKRKG